MKAQVFRKGRQACTHVLGAWHSTSNVCSSRNLSKECFSEIRIMIQPSAPKHADLLLDCGPEFFLKILKGNLIFLATGKVLEKAGGTIVHQTRVSLVGKGSPLIDFSLGSLGKFFPEFWPVAISTPVRLGDACLLRISQGNTLENFCFNIASE